MPKLVDLRGPSNVAYPSQWEFPYHDMPESLKSIHAPECPVCDHQTLFIKDGMGTHETCPVCNAYFYVVIGARRSYRVGFTMVNWLDGLTTPDSYGDPVTEDYVNAENLRRGLCADYSKVWNDTEFRIANAKFLKQLELPPHKRDQVFPVEVKDWLLEHYCPTAAEWVMENLSVNNVE